MIENLPRLSSWPKEPLRGKRVILRLDLNAPLDPATGQVHDDFRLQQALPTLNYLREAGAQIFVLSHLGDDGVASLRPIVERLKDFLPVEFLESIEVWEKHSGAWLDGGVYLLENIRRESGELANDPGLAKRLAALGELYVNDAFAVSHRHHASIVGLPALLPGSLGLLFEKEIANLSQAFAPEHPFILILGGAKFSTKLPLLKRFIYLADQLFIYGALAHAFFKELGYETGQSLVEGDTSLVQPFLMYEKINLPNDVRVKNGSEVMMKSPEALGREDSIMDIGLDSIEHCAESIKNAKLILWNGPLGRFEFGFRGGTDAIAKLIAENTAAKSIVGGGDTLDSIQSLNLLDKFSFVSTGGGAMLDFLATGTLPGLEAMKTTLAFKE